MKLEMGETSGQVIRYVLISALMNVAVLVLMYIFVDLLGMNARLAFFLDYTIVYVAAYIFNLRYLFFKEHDWKKAMKYLIYLAVFFPLANVLFALLTYLKLHYLLATILTTAVLFPLRFFTNKYFVYR